MHKRQNGVAFNMNTCGINNTQRLQSYSKKEIDICSIISARKKGLLVTLNIKFTYSLVNVTIKDVVDDDEVTI